MSTYKCLFCNKVNKNRLHNYTNYKTIKLTNDIYIKTINITFNNVIDDININANIKCCRYCYPTILSVRDNYFGMYKNINLYSKIKFDDIITSFNPKILYIFKTCINTLIPFYLNKITKEDEYYYIFNVDIQYHTYHKNINIDICSNLDDLILYFNDDNNIGVDMKFISNEMIYVEKIIYMTC